MNKVIRKEIFRVLEDESNEIGVSYGGFHCFQFKEKYKGKSFVVTINFVEVGKEGD
jgi:hypothetical protein